MNSNNKIENRENLLVPGEGNAGKNAGSKITLTLSEDIWAVKIGSGLIERFLIPADTTKQVSGFLNGLRTIWFALAFVAIGLEARFSDLVKIQGGRPALAFIAAQLFNILWTLLWAYLLFGGILLPTLDIK